MLMKSSKILTLAVTFALLASVMVPILGNGPVANAAADNHNIEVKIGLLNPLTGPIDVYAPAFTDAGDLAIAHLNDGQSDYHFSLVEADSGCDGTTAATGAQTLVDAGVVGIAGAACSGATMGAIDVAAAAGVPMVSYASTSPAITSYDDDGYLFRVVPSDAQQGQALADVFAASGYENPGVIAMTNDYGAGFHAAFLDNWDGTPCAEATYADGTTDFATHVAAVLDNNCDSVVMITYASDGAAIAEELATQGADVQIFGGDGIADVGFASEFTDLSALDGVTATKPASGAPTEYQYMFDMFYGAAAAAYGFEGGIYVRETFDAIAVIGLAAATATQTPLPDDGVREMLGTLVGGPDAPQEGASGTHIFDENGDVAGSGYDICTFNVDENDTVELDCHSSWGLLDGLDDQGIPKAPVVPGCMDSTANNYNADATVNNDSCTFDAVVPGCMDSTANNYNADATEDDPSNPCTFDAVEPEPEPEEEADEVPGFGLLSAVAAIGVVLLLRRRL